MLCARFDIVDSVAATLLSVKTTSNLRGMVRVKVDTFDIGGAAFDLTCSTARLEDQSVTDEPPSFSHKKKSLSMSKQIPVTDLNDCLLLVTFFRFPTRVLF